MFVCEREGQRVSGEGEKKVGRERKRGRRQRGKWVCDHVANVTQSLVYQGKNPCASPILLLSPPLTLLPLPPSTTSPILLAPPLP